MHVYLLRHKERRKKKRNSMNYRLCPCSGRQCALSDILILTSQSMLTETINDNTSTKVLDVCCILSLCWHWKLCQYVTFDCLVTVSGEWKHPGETCTGENNVLHPEISVQAQPQLWWRQQQQQLLVDLQVSTVCHLAAACSAGLPRSSHCHENSSHQQPVQRLPLIMSIFDWVIVFCML